ncbi:MAG: HD domain-containing protein [Ruminococcaceae bacterium]|nr:HD domain-containing protein [Oscillospiraceae bacterium]
MKEQELKSLPPITDAALAALRESVARRLSPYRMAHTLGVEETVARLATLYCPENGALLRGAALLHDLTKELSEVEQKGVFAANGVELRPDEAASPLVWHGMTAALIIPAEYPAWADPVLISAVRWHTTGRRHMTLADALLNLADCIEPGRQFADCVALRHAFWDPDPAAMTEKERRRHLRDVLLLYFENTLSKLRQRGGVICLDTLAAVEDLQNRNEF